MPGIDGFETCQRLKQQDVTCDIPVIFMTALAETVDKVRGFEVGGVDYITKPFSIRELTARIKAVLRSTAFLNSFESQNPPAIPLLDETAFLKGDMRHVGRKM